MSLVCNVPKDNLAHVYWLDAECHLLQFSLALLSLSCADQGAHTYVAKDGAVRSCPGQAWPAVPADWRRSTPACSPAPMGASAWGEPDTCATSSTRRSSPGASRSVRAVLCCHPLSGTVKVVFSSAMVPQVRAPREPCSPEVSLRGSYGLSGCFPSLQEIRRGKTGLGSQAALNMSVQASMDVGRVCSAVRMLASPRLPRGCCCS